MTEPITFRLTVRQIVTKCGQIALARHLNVSRAALRKWYANGIPGRHWTKMKRKWPWITYELLESANDIAAKKFRRAA